MANPNQDWKWQPPFTTRVDWSNPLADRLAIVVSGSASQTLQRIDPITVAFGSPTIALGVLGRGATFSGGVQTFSAGTGPVNTASEGFTIEVLCAVTAVPSLAGFFTGTFGPDGSARGLIAFPNIYFWGGSRDLDSGVPWRTDGSVQHVFCVSEGSTRPMRFYRDGALIASGTTKTLINATGSYILGDTGQGWASTPTGTIFKAAFYTRPLSDSEISQLTINPNRIFHRTTDWIFDGYGAAGALAYTGYANEALQSIVESATGRTGVRGIVVEALQAIADNATGRTGASGRAIEALQAITEQGYGFTQVNVIGSAIEALQAIAENSTGRTGARGRAVEALQAITEQSVGTITSNAVQGYAAEQLQSIQDQATGRTGVRGTVIEAIQSITETGRGITGVRGIALEGLQPLQETGFGESGAEPIAPTRPFGAPAWYGYEGFDGTRRPWWYRDLKDKAAEAERQRQIRIELGILPKDEDKRIQKTIKETLAFAEKIPTPRNADAMIAKAEMIAERIERLVDQMEEEDDEKAIMEMSRFFFHHETHARRVWQ